MVVNNLYNYIKIPLALVYFVQILKWGEFMILKSVIIYSLLICKQ